LAAPHQAISLRAIPTSGLLFSSPVVADSANTFSGIQRLNWDEFDHLTAAALGCIRMLPGRFRAAVGWV